MKIKLFLAEILCKILVKMKVSVIINFETNGDTLKGKMLDVFYYNNTFNNIKIFDMNNDELNIPNKKFHIIIPIKQQ